MASFTPLPRPELQRRYGSFFQRLTSPLDADGVPEVLRALLPYAELWGIGDDVARDELVRIAPSEARQDLLAILDDYDDDFDAWLAGPEADAASFSPEYLAFSNMRMAADYLSASAH